MSTNILFKAFTVAAFSLVTTGGGLAETTITNTGLPNPTAAAKGTTQNLSIQNGSKSSLAFGTNTSFGASLSSQSSSGMNVTAVSNFVPADTSIMSSIGSSVNAPGVTKAVISNLKAQGNGTLDTPLGSISTADAIYASGNALLEGVGASIDIKLAGGGSNFTVEASPNVVGGDPCSVKDGTCVYSLPDGTKPYDAQQFGSGNATATIMSNTTVDIQTNQFSSTFAQSF